MFTLLILAQACSLTGGYVQTLVLSWVAAELGGGLYSLAAYMIACYLPVAVLSYPFGRWLDRKNQKPWLIGSELVLTALSFLLWQVAAAERLSFAFLLGFGGVWGVVRALQTPIYQSLPRRLTENLSCGTALLTAVTYAARGIGPLIGGFLYHRYGAAVPFLVNFLSFVPSVALLCFLKLPPPEAGKRPALRPRLPALLTVFFVGFFGVNYNVTFVALVREAGLGSFSYGVALGLLGAGALLGFWLKGRLKRPLPIALFPAVMGGLNFALAFSEGLLLRGILIFLYGIADFWFFATAVYRLSHRAEKEELTAVMGLYTVVSVGALPIGALLWSFVAKTFGITATLCCLGAGLSAVYFIIRRKR